MDERLDDVAYPTTTAFITVHLACVAAVWTGVTTQAVMLGVVLYVVRMFAVGAGYHRYFSHRSYRTSRVFQFLLACLAQSSAQRGILWWAAHHRRHHKYSDTDNDTHSPVRKGLLHAHLGWIFVRGNDPTDLSAVSDFACFPELRWLDRHPYLPSVLLGTSTWLLGGWPALIVGFCWSTVAVWHATFSVNSLGHLFGRRRYVTGDHSRNNWLLALLTMGEGWHNNHHACQVSARQGFRWWEYDPTFYALKSLSWVGIVWGLRTPSRTLIKGEQRLGRKVIEKTAAQIAASFPINTIANQALVGLSNTAGWAQLRTRVLSATLQAGAFWAMVEIPSLPTFGEVRACARARLQQNSSLDEIAICARRRLLELVYAQIRMQTTAQLV